MKKRLLSLFSVVMVLVAALALAGCAVPSSTAAVAPNTTNSSLGVLETPPAANSPNLVSSVPSANTGALQIRVTDAPAKDNITAVNVTVSAIEIHSDNGTSDNGTWFNVPLGADNKTFELFTVKVSPKTLTTAFPKIGDYTQIRMTVEKVVVTLNGKDVEATVPSGKIKFIQPFKIADNATSDLLFDFDAAKSINVTGNGKVMFKPVIKLTVGKENKGQDSKLTNTPNNTQTNNQAKALEIVTSTLPDGTVNDNYTAPLIAKGGSGEYTWSAKVPAELPAGLSVVKVNNQWRLSGTPTLVGAAYNFTLVVSDQSDPVQTVEKAFTIAVKAATP